MFPEAGGSSSFARHAFNDVVSFFAGWALSLDYILTIAISAFFVPHYLSAFPGLHALKHNPGDIIGGLIVVGAARRAEHPRPGRVGEAELRPRDPRPEHAGPARRARAACWSSTRRCWSTRCTSAASPSWKELIFALSLAMLAYTGIETVANMAEESQATPGRQVPKAVNLVVIAVLGVYAGISVVALSALPVVHHGVGYSPALKESFHHPGYATALGGFFENDPVLGIISRLGLHGTVLHLARVLRRHARRDDPVHRHQRGHDRHLAAVVVAGRAPPAAGDLLPAAPEVPHAVVHARVLLGARRRADPVRQHRSARQPLLVRRDAVVHDRPRRGRSRCASRTPTASGPTACPGTCASAAR